MKLKYKVAAAVAVIAGVTTVVPAPASKPCLLGYYAHCSWTPLSTLICLAIAGIAYWLGLRWDREAHALGEAAQKAYDETRAQAEKERIAEEKEDDRE